MTRKALNAFNPDTLRAGHSKSFEVRNPATGFGELHYFYRHRDGELFFTVTKNVSIAIGELKDWKAKKEARKNNDITLIEGPIYRFIRTALKMRRLQKSGAVGREIIETQSLFDQQLELLLNGMDEIDTDRVIKKSSAQYWMKT